MGCGSSSLKGEKVEDIQATQPQMKKVRTNFSDVDFSGEASHRRGTVAVAPNEQRRPTEIPETVDEGIAAIPAATNADTPAKEPYKPIADDIGLASPTTDRPAIQIPDNEPTSNASKQDFATSNDPTHHQTSSTLSPPSHADQNQEQNQEPRRKSWLAKFSRGKSTSEISDEELQRTTGMTRAQFEEWKKDPKNNVAGNRVPGNEGLVHGTGVM